MGRMDGKIAFLTGGGAGIARACARAFVAEGAKVALVDINAEVGRAAEQEIRDAGGEAIFIEADVTREESVQAAMERHAQHFGRLDVLVNCAGGSLLEDAPVHEMKLEVWQRTIALNLLHPFLCCKYGIPHMMRGGGGSIINFSSQTGLMGSVRPAYAQRRAESARSRRRWLRNTPSSTSARTPLRPAASAPNAPSSAIRARTGCFRRIPRLRCASGGPPRSSTPIRSAIRWISRGSRCSWVRTSRA